MVHKDQPVQREPLVQTVHKDQPVQQEHKELPAQLVMMER